MRIDEDLNNVFVTADNHFGHENIIGFTNRPFESVEEMDKVMIENWNRIIEPDDLVFHLGDFTLGNDEMAQSYFSQLNGRIHILYNTWHHDKRWISRISSISGGTNFLRMLPPLYVLEVPGLGKDGHPLAITLCHYPLAVWDRRHYGAWHLHGHSHGNYQGEGYIIDVGVDCMNYTPISLAGVLEIMYGRGWV